MQNESIKKDFNYSLFIALLVLNFIPAINEAVKVLFINTNAVSMSVMSQIEWFDLINEILMAALITPMYSVLNSFIKDKELFNKKVFQCGVITTVLYGLFLAVVYMYVNKMVGAMFTGSIEEVRMAEEYLKLETIGFIAGIVFSYVNVVFVVLGKSSYIYVFVVVKTVTLIIANAILIPKFGGLGVAYANILTNTGLGAISIIILIKNQLIVFSTVGFKDILLFKKWGRVGVFQGLTVLVANIVYSNVVVKMINNVQGLGDYWVANNFIWGWLLIPTYALAEVIKSECKDGYSNLNFTSHKKILIGTVVIWIISIPAWSLIFKYTMGVEDTSVVLFITLKLLPFYIAYLISSYIESIMQGLGLTEYCLAGTLFVNIVYYGFMLILTKNGVFEPSLNFAILLFGFGMVVLLIVDIFIKKNILDKKYYEVKIEN